MEFVSRRSKQAHFGHWQDLHLLRSRISAEVLELELVLAEIEGEVQSANRKATEGNTKQCSKYCEDDIVSLRMNIDNLGRLAGMIKDEAARVLSILQVPARAWQTDTEDADMLEWVDV